MVKKTTKKTKANRKYLLDIFDRFVYIISNIIILLINSVEDL